MRNINYKSLTCPNCKGKLKLKLNKFNCPKCGIFFAEKNSVIDFLGKAKKSGFKSRFYKRIDEVENKHFWFKGRQEIIYAVAYEIFKKRNINFLELGCGTESDLKLNLRI